jgi:hypothetical protein
MFCSKAILVWAVALLCLIPRCRAAAWDTPAAELSRQIVAVPLAGQAKLVIVNRSTIPVSEIPAIRRLLEQDLRGSGVTLVSSGETVVIRVTLSQNTEHGLWVAEVQQGSDSKVFMVTVDLPSAEALRSNANISLRRSFLVADTAPILDVAFVSVGTERRMLVLGAEELRSYRLQDNAWVKEQALSITHSQPFPRDVRGRIVAAAGHLFDLYLPGVLCAGSDAGGSIALACAERDDPWSLAEQKAFYNSTRNFFTGVLVPGLGAEVGPFFSAASLVLPRGSAMVFTRVSGDAVLMSNGESKSLPISRDWGSDIAGLRSSCGSGSQILVSESPSPAAESLRAYELSGGEPVPVSSPLSVDGAVSAIWPANDGTTATVILQKQQPMQYEAYSVSVSCN